MAEPFHRLNLPDIGPELAWPDVRGLITEYGRLQAEHHRATAALEELLASRAVAIERDRLGYAQAIRAGKETPARAS